MFAVLHSDVVSYINPKPKKHRGPGLLSLQECREHSLAVAGLGLNIC